MVWFSGEMLAGFGIKQLVLLIFFNWGGGETVFVCTYYLF